MTIPAEQTRYVYAGPYAIGDTIPIPFSYKEPLHVKAATEARALVLNVDYTVLGQNLTLKIAIASGTSIAIYRETPLDNDAEFPQEAEFDSEKINDSIDKLTMIAQEYKDAIDRSVQFPIFTPTEGGGSVSVALPPADPGKCLKWNTTGTALVNTTHDLDNSIGYVADQAALAAQSANQASQSAAAAQAAAANAASKAELNAVAAAKQDKLTAGNYIQITSGNIISSNPESMMQGLTQSAWDALTPAEKAAIPLALIYE